VMGKAGRPLLDDAGTCVILCHAPKKERLKKLLYDPLPVESHLDHYLHDHFNSEIVTKTITSMQDAVDYITWTFLYRRLTKNPNYYNLQQTSNTHLSEHMSEMIETVLSDLEESKCCKMNAEGDVSPLNLGMIAAYYYVQYTTVELVATSITRKTKTRGVLEILSAASEYSQLPMRSDDEKLLRILSTKIPHKIPPQAQFHDPNTKALILLQCHFGRKPLSPELKLDQTNVLQRSLPLVQAIVDVISSQGWLKPALAAMEISQMLVQGLWNKDHVLLQIPHFSPEILRRCANRQGEDPVESVFDVLALEEDARNDLLRLSEGEMSDVAVFCNNYPDLEVSPEVVDPDSIVAGDPAKIVVRLERDVEEEEEDVDLVSAPLFPGEKREGWWIVLGDAKTNSLLSIKRVSLKVEVQVTLEFVAPEEPGDYDLTLFCMSDSYLGCDQELSVPISIGAPDTDDDEEEDEEDGGMEAEEKDAPEEGKMETSKKDEMEAEEKDAPEEGKMETKEKDEMEAEEKDAPEEGKMETKEKDEMEAEEKEAPEEGKKETKEKDEMEVEEKDTPDKDKMETKENDEDKMET